jgi:hypothetical protein
MAHDGILHDFTTSMKTMERPLKPSPEKFPKHVVPNNTIGAAGLTYSVENEGAEKDGIAEFDVLKSILNREGYLSRLFRVARTVGKKFKPEVADVLDLVRASSLDVVEAILRWREVKVQTLCFIFSAILQINQAVIFIDRVFLRFI